MNFAMNFAVIDAGLVVKLLLLLLIGMGPKVALVPFLEKTKHLDAETQRAVGRRMVVTAVVTAIVLFATGWLLLRLLHVSGGAVAVGGAIVLGILAVNMAAGPLARIFRIALSLIFLTIGHGAGSAEDAPDPWQFRQLQAAAEKGEAAAQTELGEMYENGQGVTQSNAKALGWFRKAADQGYAKAQFDLGTAYDNGDGVEEDHSLAAMWWGLAAEQGNAEAEDVLGDLYFLGDPAVEDDAEARPTRGRGARSG